MPNTIQLPNWIIWSILFDIHITQLCKMKKPYVLCISLLVRPNIELDSVLKEEWRGRRIFVHVRNTHTLPEIEHIGYWTTTRDCKSIRSVRMYIYWYNVECVFKCSVLSIGHMDKILTVETASLFISIKRDIVVYFVCCVELGGNVKKRWCLNS